MLDNVAISEWKLNYDKFSDHRLRVLEQNIAFSVISGRIASDMTEIKFVSEKGNREAKGKKRARFSFNVKTDTLDLFFNSQHGYRAQYYIDPERGILANRLVINMVTNQLIKASLNTSQSLLSMNQIKKSIEYMSAKIWIDEDASTLNQKSQDPKLIQYIDIPRWVDAMNHYLASLNSGQMLELNSEKALLGVQAPQGRLLQIIGAWLDDSDNEFIVPSKTDRAIQIYKYGFS